MLPDLYLIFLEFHVEIVRKVRSTHPDQLHQHTVVVQIPAGIDRARMDLLADVRSRLVDEAPRLPTVDGLRHDSKNVAALHRPSANHLPENP